MLLKRIIHRLNHRDFRLIPRIPKYLKFILVIGVIVSLTFIARSGHAEDSTQNLFLNKQDAISTGGNQEAWLDEALGSNFMSFFIALVGKIPKSFFDSFNTTGMVPRFMPQGAIGVANKYIATTFNPPASGIEYIASTFDNILGKPAYAQGVGFKGLEFLLPIWRGFRNIVYVISSLVFIIIGIMIILRIKVSPQAVITIQSSIPGVITALILVTFSYAIAGLVIDIGNLLLGLVIAILFSMNGSPLSGNLFKNFWWGTGFPILSDLGNGLGWIFNQIVGAAGGNTTFSFNNLVDPNLRDLQMLSYRAMPGWVAAMMLGGLAGSIVIGFFLGGVGNAVLGTTGNVVGDFFGRALGGVVGGLLGALILPIIFSIIVGVWLIKLYFGLIKTYVTLIFKIILAPLEIAMGAFPNSKMNFSSWFKDVIANVAVFPIVTIFLVLLNLLVDAVAGGTLGSTVGIAKPAVWAPGLISAGGISPSILAAAIGMAGLALLAKLPSMVPEFIFMIKPSPFGKAIGEGLGDVAKPAKFVAQAGLEYGADQLWKNKDYNAVTKILSYGVSAGRSLGLIDRRKK